MCGAATTPIRQVHSQGLFSHSLEYLSEPSSSDECNVYQADSFLNGIADTIQKEFSAKLSVQLLHLIHHGLVKALCGQR